MYIEAKVEAEFVVEFLVESLEYFEGVEVYVLLWRLDLSVKAPKWPF